jgi:hypothetical protein
MEAQKERSNVILGRFERTGHSPRIERLLTAQSYVLNKNSFLSLSVLRSEK